MPAGYTDYAFNLLSDSCRVWYYEIQSSIAQSKSANENITIHLFWKGRIGK